VGHCWGVRGAGGGVRGVLLGGWGVSLTVPGTLWDRSVGQVLGLKTGYGEVSIEDKVVHGVT